LAKMFAKCAPSGLDGLVGQNGHANLSNKIGRVRFLR